MWRVWRDRQYLWHWRRHHHHIRVLLTLGNFTVELLPKETIHMATTINAGQTLPMTIEYTDSNGNKTSTWPTDAAPAWSDTTPATDTLVAAADGNSATALGSAAGGDDTINLALSAGGVPFSATLALTVVPVVVAPTLASIAIIPGTPTP